ncbi:hypothetical protein QWY90_03290 [Flavobacterium paronense]|uniref:Lipoprotein n=1 Tax=Flavobacterium paronense TaxID=1392775 RepID=A0ABV5GFZ8_9FLAO|nr:hypothetical protein [Flavobacterium paronense]MDN3676332.1 hypothetical protein [Flavobacterium paronense]
MSYLKFIIIGILFFTFSSCKNEKTEFSINSFRKLPKEIEGCTCIFSKTEKDYEQKEYVFASNFDSIAFVSINNKIIKLKLKSRVCKPNTVENEDYTCKYETEEYKVTIEIKADKTKKDADESWWNKGVISIENKNGEKVTQEFIGESGC